MGRIAITLAAPGEPPLLLTQVPLLQVPAGCVNVHGHVHQKRSPSRKRHINVSAEQLDYRPVRLCDIRRLARRLVEGRTVPGRSTRARLHVVGRALAAAQTGILPTAAVIWSLVQRQRLGTARQLLSSLPDAFEYRKLRALLLPPRTWTAPSRDRDRSADFRWLHQHGRDYVGRWVAVAGGSLLADAVSLHALRSQLRQSAPHARPLIHFIR